MEIHPLHFGRTKSIFDLDDVDDRRTKTKDERSTMFRNISPLVFPASFACLIQD